MASSSAFERAVSEMLERFGQSATNIASTRGYKLLDREKEGDCRAVERHGAWEWTFGRLSKELNRYVIVAVSLAPKQESARTVSLLLRIWAAADNRERYHRLLIIDEEIKYPSVSGSDIEVRLKKAIDAAETLKVRDLDERYLTPATWKDFASP